jgi:hypothetical protein
MCPKIDPVVPGSDPRDHSSMWAKPYIQVVGTGIG